MVTSDHHRGLVNAIQKHFQGASWQRSQVQADRHGLGKVGKRHQRAIADDVRAVFLAPSLEWARELKGQVVVCWSVSHPWVAEWLETALEHGLTCFAFPESHRWQIRSKNDLERFNQALKRRTRVVRIFPNPDACLRLDTLCVEQSEEWLVGCTWR